jgi:hypothetical protein
MLGAIREERMKQLALAALLLSSPVVAQQAGEAPKKYASDIDIDPSICTPIRRVNGIDLWMGNCVTAPETK